MLMTEHTLWRFFQFNLKSHTSQEAYHKTITRYAVLNRLLWTIQGIVDQKINLVTPMSFHTLFEECFLVHTIKISDQDHFFKTL